MKKFNFILKLLFRFIKILAYGWIFEGIYIAKKLWKGIKKLCRELKKPDDEKDNSGSKCATINHPSFHRPDPCIYSQSYLKSLGLAFTWDNPDIYVMKDGLIVAEHELVASTEYEINATVWNNSYDAPAMGMHVDFAYKSFGAGAGLHPIGNSTINLGVKGGTNHPATAKILWVTPPVPGHYCLKAELFWIDDANPENNVGHNNIRIIKPLSPAQADFQLRNDTKKSHKYYFEIDTYTIPIQKNCNENLFKKNTKTRPERLKQILPFHSKDNFPIPPGWKVELSPQTIGLSPGEETTIHVTITPPAGFTGRQHFNINAFYENKFAEGITLAVDKG